MPLRDRGTRAGYLDPVILAAIEDGVTAQVNIESVSTGVEFPVIIAPGTTFTPNDFWLEISRGNVTGMKVYTIPGRSDGVSNASLEDVSQVPGTLVLPTPGGIQMELVSSSGNDTGAGSGVQQVEVHYLDTSGVEQSETVVMNGIVPINTVAVDIDAIQWIHAKVVGGGAGGVAAGNISLRDTAGATTYEYIAVGGNQSLSARYTVPAGKTGYILGWDASGITKRIDFRLRATVERFERTLIPGVFLFQDAVVLQDAPSPWRPMKAPNKVPAGGVIKVSAISSAAGGDAGASFDVLLIDN